jgi:2-keto-4-pentenoate hydratase
MTSIDPRLAAALATQFLQWRATLGQGAARIGWKLGVGDRERIGDELAIGHLTTATHLEPGAAYHADDAGDLRADAEVAFELGRDVDPNDPAAAAIAGVGVALEIVDLARPPDDPVSVVAANIFHRAVAFGPFQPARPAGGIRGRLLVNGRTRASAAVPPADELAGRVQAAARLLGAMGERLEAGDRIITGSVVQVAVGVGDEVIADLGPLGRVDLSIWP